MGSMRGWKAVAVALACCAVVLSLNFALGGGTAVIQRVSVTSLGVEATGNSTSAAISPDGRYVVFISSAENLAPNEGTFVRDVFLRDRLLGTTERVSIPQGGGEGNGHSSGLGAGGPALSSDARFVAFTSSATNMVPNDGNDADDVFVRDRLLGTTERVSVASEGTEADAVSVAPSISGDGRYVTFSSNATTLVADDGNNDRDIFLRDRQTGTTELTSVATDGTHGNFSSGGIAAGPASITSDGRFVVYGSFANNLVANDDNGWDDVFLRDRVAGTTERISVASDGTEGNGHSIYPSISDDGRFVAFASLADNLAPGDDDGVYDVFLRDRQAGVTTLISVGMGGQETNGTSRFPAFSDDGSFIVFQSDASNLVPNDANNATDVFKLDRQAGTLERVSLSFKGLNTSGPSGFPVVSNLGTVVAFESFATNLVPNDGNNSSDIFAYGPDIGPAPTASYTPARTATATRTATSVSAPTPTRTRTPAAQRGDANCDRRIDSIDAALILQYDAGLAQSLPCAASADANGDGRINAIDSALVLQVVAGFLDSLPA